jgi:hypothetical protein
MYADELIMFASPTVTDLSMVRTIFDIFDGASGLSCNMAKCQLVPIRCSEEQIQAALSSFPCQRADFPITYLGMPLSVYKLPCSALQPTVDKMAGKLPAWKGKLLHRNGRLTLVKTTLAAMPVFTAISVELPPWLPNSMERIMKGFLWAGSEAVHGGKCVVAWARVQRPLHLGGLGVIDITLLGRGLHACWLWQRRTDLARSCAGLPCQTDPVTEAFFKSLIICVVGNGESTMLWSDPRLDGESVANHMPQLVEAVPACLQQRRTVASALAGSAWIHDIKGALSIPVLSQYLHFRQRLQVSTPRIQHTKQCSLVSLPSLMQRKSERPKPPASASSSYGSPCSTDAGRLSADGGMACRTARCATRRWKHLPTSP